MAVSVIPTPEERKVIQQAKQKLLTEFAIEESVAYGIMRKVSMDRGINMLELAKGILSSDKVFE